MVLQKYLAGILFQNRKLPFRDRLWKFKSSKHGTDFYLICSWTRPSQTKELETRLSYRQFFPMPPKGFFEVQEVNRETLILFSANYLKKRGLDGGNQPWLTSLCHGETLCVLRARFQFSSFTPANRLFMHDSRECQVFANWKDGGRDGASVELVVLFLPARSKWYFSFQLSKVCERKGAMLFKRIELSGAPAFLY